MHDEIIDPIERDLKNLELSANKTDATRQSVIDKLSAIVTEMSIDPNDRATVVEAKRGLIDTLLKALNDVDSQKKNILQLKQKKRDSEIAEDSMKVIGRTVTEFMKNLDTRISTIQESGAIQNDDIDDDLSAVVAESGVVLSEGETEIAGITAKDISV
jgi:uncharacterized coiled-coil protein SlyX